MKNRFRTAILKEENHELTLVNCEIRYSCKKSLDVQR